MRGWAGKALGGESPGRGDSGASEVEVLGEGPVESEVGDGVGPRGVEGRSLIGEVGLETSSLRTESTGLSVAREPG